MGMLSIIFLLGIALCANSEACPSEAEITPCTCRVGSLPGYIKVECQNLNGDLKAEDLTNAVKNLAGRENVEMQIYGFDLRKVPFNFLQGIGVLKLKIENCDVPNVNEDNQKILIGLENSIEELRIRYSITADNDLSKLSFAHLRKLKEVEFSSNNISEVHAGWFEDSTPEVVRIFYNDVQNVEERAFAGLKNLKVFDFSVEKKYGAFQRSLLPVPADHLTKLDLDANKYSSLEEDIFSDMPVLKEVSLQLNLLQTLDRDTWELVWEQLDSLHLRNNPIQCDSDLAWTFALRRPRWIWGTCEGPNTVEGTGIGRFIDSGRGN